MTVWSEEVMHSDEPGRLDGSSQLYRAFELVLRTKALLFWFSLTVSNRIKNKVRRVNAGFLMACHFLLRENDSYTSCFNFSQVDKRISLRGFNWQLNSNQSTIIFEHCWKEIKADTNAVCKMTPSIFKWSEATGSQKWFFHQSVSNVALCAAGMHVPVDFIH